MGLLDFEDPQKQMLLMMGLGLLGGTKQKSLGGNIAEAGLLGLQGYQNAQNAQMKKQAFQQDAQMRSMQMDQMKRQADQQGRIDALAPQYFSSGAPLTPNDDQGYQMPPAPPRQDFQGYAQALMGLDPMKGLAMQAQLAQMNAKERVKVGPGETIGSYQGDKFVPAFSAPDKPPAGFSRGADGNLTVDPNWFKAQVDIAQAKRPQITIDNKQESAFATKLGSQQAEDYNGLMKSDVMATSRINKLDRLGNLLNQSGKTGKLTPSAMELKSVADSLGFKVDPRLPFQQAAQALSAELALEMRNPSGGAGMPGALSDQDRQFLQNMVPNLAKTPEGNAQLLETAKKLAQREKDVAKLARQYKQSTGRFDEGFNAVLSDFSEKNPLFKMDAPGLTPDEQRERDMLRKRFGLSQ